MWECAANFWVTSVVRTQIAVIAYQCFEGTIAGGCIARVTGALTVVIADFLVVLTLAGHGIATIRCTRVVVVALSGRVFARLCRQVAFVTDGAGVVVVAVTVLSTTTAGRSWNQLIDTSDTRLAEILGADIVVVAVDR